MGQYKAADRRLGMWSALMVAALGVAYVITGAIGLPGRPPGSEPLRQVDPYLAILEVLIILSAVTLVVMMAAVYAYASSEKKTCSLAAFAFMVMFAVITCGVHFVSLSVGRQLQADALPLLSRQLSFEKWPSIALALDLLSWDFFLGLSLLFAAPVFRGDRFQDWLCRMMFSGGLLCLGGTLGPAFGRMKIQYLAIAGYAFVLPVACGLLALVFKRSTPRDTASSLV